MITRRQAEKLHYMISQYRSNSINGSAPASYEHLYNYIESLVKKESILATHEVKINGAKIEGFVSDSDCTAVIDNGITLRDQFAIAALTNLSDMEKSAFFIADKAYSIADEMLEKRKTK